MVQSHALIADLVMQKLRKPDQNARASTDCNKGTPMRHVTFPIIYCSYGGIKHVRQL